MSLFGRRRWYRRLIAPTVAAAAVVIGAAAMPADSTPTPPTSAASKELHAALADTARELGLPDQPAQAADAAQAAASAGSIYKPITPTRVLDTRLSLGGRRLQSRVAETFNVLTPEVLSAAGLDATTAANVTAVQVNITATRPDGAGFVSIWPGGLPWPGSSNLGIQRPGHTVPNLVTTPVASGGLVQALASTNTDLIADVQGVYVAASGPQTAGRFVALGPTRVLDTRLTGNPLQPGAPFDVDLVAAGISIPADASAVALNVTAVASPGSQFLTVWPAGQSRPLASNLNLEYPGQTLPNAVVAGLSAGKVSVVATAGGHLVIDVAGYFTGNSAPASTDGLFVAVTPTRILDTRLAAPPTWGQRPAAGNKIAVPLAGQTAVPTSGVAALTLNLTATQTAGPGFVTAYPDRTNRPTTSVLNPNNDGDTVASQVVSPVSSDGLALFTANSSHLVVDVTGYFTGPAVAATLPPDPPPLFNDIKPAAQPSSPPTTGPFALMYTVTGGYARWNPCAPLRFAVNIDKATSAAQVALLDDVIHEAEAASGVDFVFAGYTSTGYDGTPPAGADAVFAFTNTTTSPQLGSAVGLGGGSYYDLGGGKGKVSRGFAIFVPDYGMSVYQRELMLHEIGHTLGLGHVQDTGEVMNPYVVPVPHYGPGDMRGLWSLGSAQGCINSGFDYAPASPASPASPGAAGIPRASTSH